MNTVQRPLVLPRECTAPVVRFLKTVSDQYGRFLWSLEREQEIAGYALSAEYGEDEIVLRQNPNLVARLQAQALLQISR